MTVAGGDALLQALHRTFGHVDFREGQRAVVEAVVAGDDVTLVMPTGGGKSLCYQLPALLAPRPTVVISPLIALMHDQVAALQSRGVAAAALHSNIDAATQRQLVRAYAAGLVRLLYVAPERLVRSDFRSMLAATPPQRIVVDEAHCISEWGHDFRRDYLRIGEVVAALRPLQLVACTATATEEVRADIAARLGMRAVRAFVHGFGRPNLHLSAERSRTEADKLARLDELIDPGDGHAIVYAGTRARAAALAERLQMRFPTMLYHGDLSAEARSRAQARFSSGEVRVAVTTSAFGMGIDVPTVRQVIHVALPGSLEEYYQQAGRAGRDGLPARCVILHAPADRRLQEFFIESGHPDAATVATVYAALRRLGHDPGSWRAAAAARAGGPALSDAAGDAARELLRAVGVIATDGAVSTTRGPEAVDHGRVAEHRRHAYRRLERLIAYLAPSRCRHRLIIEHFGEVATEERCGTECDVCAGDARPEAPLDQRTLLQALSAVARLNDRVGMVRLAGVLTGSRRREVTSIAGAEQLAVFGALSAWREADVVELMRRLVDCGALRQGSPPYATVALTDLGASVLRGGAAVSVDDPRHDRTVAGGGQREGRSAGDVTAPERGTPEWSCFERLRAWRSLRARQRGVPSYVVFADRTLAELARRRPGDRAALLAVPGVGPHKLELYGDELLRVLASAA